MRIDRILSPALRKTSEYYMGIVNRGRDACAPVSKLYQISQVLIFQLISAIMAA